MTDPSLVCYVRFDEADGKHFTEEVNSERGYLTPNEPYVNEDNELVFTGYKCLALPSFKSSGDADVESSDYDMDMRLAYQDRSEDGAYDGGILWDTQLLKNIGGDPDYVTDHDYLVGVYKGVAQIRLKLRQLKEGVICGRLGIFWNRTDQEFQLFFANTTDGYVTYGGTVDESWIGTEKTITVWYDGAAATGSTGEVLLYIDDSVVSTTTATGVKWQNNSDNIASGTYRAFLDSPVPAADVFNYEVNDGAIGGSPSVPDHCIAFDLVFFRQWWDDPPYGDLSGSLTFADFVAATYDQEDLPDTYRYAAQGLRGNYEDTSQSMDMGDGLDGIGYSAYQYRAYAVLPLTYTGRGYTSVGEGFITLPYIEDSIGGLHPTKTDVWVKRILEWGADSIRVWRGNTSEVLHVNDIFISETDDTPQQFANGIIFSNLVNEYNWKTFKDRTTERGVFTYALTIKEYDLGANEVDVEERNIRLFEVVLDDSPLHGVEHVGVRFDTTRYLILNATADRTASIYGLRSFRPRWSDGPIPYTFDDQYFPPVRSLFRYRSEDNSINALFAIIENQLLEIDTESGSAESRHLGWIDRNDDDPVNTQLCNNRAIIMDSKAAIKLNHLGNASRLGVELPVGFYMENCERKDIVANYSEQIKLFTKKSLHGYAVQFYDPENDSYSGALPVFADRKQTIYIYGGTSGKDYISCIMMGIRCSKDKNISHFILCRTRDLNDTGNEDILYRIVEGRCTREENVALVNDAWSDDRITTNAIIPSTQNRQDLVPKACKAMATAYGRLFVFGSEKERSTLYWSDVDALGLARVDQFPFLNSMVVEEGGTAGGTALIEYGGILYAFKDNAIFRISQYGDGLYGKDLIYKGVGAVNQRCVTVAGNSIFFLDKNGIFQYQGGEPVMVSVPLLDFFGDHVDQDNIDKAFLLHNKEDETIMAFVPSSGSSWCDRCVILDLRKGVFTVDIVPQVTCGFVDGPDVYLGGRFGAILKYNKTTYADYVTPVTGTCTVSGTAVTLTTGYLEEDGSYLGAPVILVDATNLRIWRSNITGYENDSMTIETPTPLFNASGVSASGSLTYYIGHMFLYDKSSQLAFPPAEAMYEKVLREVQYMANTFANADELMNKLDMDADGSNTLVSELEVEGVLARCDVLNGMHKSFVCELALVTDSEFALRNSAYFVESRQGRVQD